MPSKYSSAASILTVGALASMVSACSTTATEPQATATADATHAEQAHEHGPSTITSDAGNTDRKQSDLVATMVERDGDELVFHAHVVDVGEATPPPAAGDLDGAPVWSYVWPTSLDSSTVGFEAGQGILALAATSHPDFDDTPLYDEDGDGDLANDGATWHAHWVVLGETEQCAAGLAVIGIPEGETPAVPDTWPGLPLLLDSPDLATWTSDDGVMVRLPASDIGDAAFQFDGVTAGLRVSTSPHDPLLCVEDVWDIASGDLSLPGESPTRERQRWGASCIRCAPPGTMSPWPSIEPPSAPSTPPSSGSLARSATSAKPSPPRTDLRCSKWASSKRYPSAACASATSAPSSRCHNPRSPTPWAPSQPRTSCSVSAASKTHASSRSPSPPTAPR